MFPGEEAFSEVEMRNIRDFVMGLETTPVLSQCFHSYSQLWLWPYGYDYGAYPENWQELEQLAIDACDALQGVHGTIFDPINSADLCKKQTNLNFHLVLSFVHFRPRFRSC